MIRPKNSSEFQDIGHSVSNVFGIETPDSFVGSIQNYSISHRQLNIQFTDEKGKRFHLIFVEVRYLQCPTGWKGANFKTASEAECTDLLFKLLYVQEQDRNHDYWNHYRLYIVDTETTQIKILAAGSEYQERQIENPPKDIQLPSN